MEVTQIDYLHEIGSKKNQEDYLWPGPGTASLQDRIFIVCDGVGGSDSGEVASRLVAETVGGALLATKPSQVDLPMINRLLEEARLKLVEHATAAGLPTEMATTFTLLLLLKAKAFVAWCGDSRVYHLRKDEVLFRTEDHSVVNSLIRKGELTVEEGRTHPQKNLLLKAVMADNPNPEAEGHWIDDIQDGDYFIMCTDGLLENVSDADMLFLLHQNELGEIDLGKAFGKYAVDKTKDNYSMYLIRVRPEVGALGAGDSGAGAGDSGADALGVGAAADEPVVARKGVRRRIGWLVFLLVILIAAAAFIIKENYFKPHKEINVLVPVNRDKDSMEKAQDSAK